MNLLNKKWIKFKNKNITIQKKGGKLILKNSSKDYGYVIIPKLFKLEEQNIEILFNGKVLNGNSALLYILDLKKNILLEQTLNSITFKDFSEKRNAIIAIKILANSEVVISNIELNITEQVNTLDYLNNDTLIISPSYPSMENKYLCGFVHSRLKAYKESGIKFDLVVCHSYNEITKYSFEGVDVLKIPFSELRNILQKKKYKKILVHFFDTYYANVLDACDLTDSQLYLWVHGPETLYWDWPKFMTLYFNKPYELSNYDIDIFKKNDKLINKYNKLKNVKWIFVSEWIKKRSEELTGIKFNNYEVIPNIIDSNNFNFVDKNPELRKKVFFLRRFDNCNKYAIDVNVRTILELSRRDCFRDMEFNIYGTGALYNELVEPLRKFSNVHLYQKFLTHEEISEVHKENGIALFATRYDAQGVSMCEAAMSGLAVVASKNEAIEEFLSKNMGLMANQENYVEYADIIESLYNDEKKFKECCKKCHEKVYLKCNFDATIKKEIKMIKEQIEHKQEEEKEKVLKHTKKILSVIIPAYNVSQFLKHTVRTILNHKNKFKIEVIIVNDGSKDHTSKIAKDLIKEYNKDINIINFIDKENGGHGSTINAGLKAATGKYTRIIDGDDWVDSEEIEKLIDVLEKENSDIVLTNYSEDRAIENIKILKEIYTFMVPGLQYKFEDLCYANYGFGEWGPILATGNFKTEMLQKLKFTITEKCFYVDMEFNMYSILDANTISFYPLDIYRYFIGRSGQSISKKSYIKNKAQHEKVLFNIIKYIEEHQISEMKKKYILEKIVYPMIKAHYVIITEYIHNIKEFNKFDSQLKQYPIVYNKNIINRYTKLNRKTKGLILPFGKILIKVFRRG